MTRDELEAVIWRNWPSRGGQSAKAVDHILAAADAYRASPPAEIGHTSPVADLPPHDRDAARHLLELRQAVYADRRALNRSAQLDITEAMDPAEDIHPYGATG